MYNNVQIILSVIKPIIVVVIVWNHVNNVQEHKRLNVQHVKMDSIWQLINVYPHVHNQHMQMNRMFVRNVERIVENVKLKIVVINVIKIY